MKRKIALFSVLLLFGLCAAGVYDLTINGTLGKILTVGAPGYDDYSGFVREVVPATDMVVP